MSKIISNERYITMMSDESGEAIRKLEEVCKEKGWRLGFSNELKNLGVSAVFSLDELSIVVDTDISIDALSIILLKINGLLPK